MRSDAKTVKEYLEGLPEDRRQALKKVRAVVRKNLPKGYEEAMNWGMISYQVPLKTCPDTYNGQPLMYAALASQKNHMAIYMTGVYMSEKTRKEFEKAYKAAGKRLDAGKCCVRFKKLDDLPLDVIARTIGEYPVDVFVDSVQSVRTKSRKTRRK
jgi:uncharacterized protein YdhG (YjbR/CyaY superfamily)